MYWNAGTYAGLRATNVGSAGKTPYGPKEVPQRAPPGLAAQISLSLSQADAPLSDDVRRRAN
jgi:hypothetical protein